MHFPSIKDIKKHILYNGLSKRLYKKCNYILIRENNSTMHGLSFITFVAGALLSLLSVSGLLSRNVLPAYLFLFLSSVVFMLFRGIFKKAKKLVSHTICFMQAACLLIFGILNSAIFSASPEIGESDPRPANALRPARQCAADRTAQTLRRLHVGLSRGDLRR